MTPGETATIILDESLTRAKLPLMELEALAAQAVALLVCRAEVISATIFRKPKGDSYWISTMDAKRNIRGLFELKRRAPWVDFEIVNRTASDLVSTG